MHVSSEQLNAEHNNLINCWTSIDFEKSSRQINKLFELTKNIRNNSSKNEIKNIIRKFNDTFGLKAHKQNSNFPSDPINLCSGSFYRTSKFINIKFEHRNFINKSLKKIHIEHTIPVEEVYKELLKFRRFTNNNELILWLLNRSIGTAFHQNQANKKHFPNDYLICNGYNSKSDVFYEKSTGFNKPFLRYVTHEKKEDIWDVLNKLLINPNKFTLDDHKNNIKFIAKKLEIESLKKIIANV